MFNRRLLFQIKKIYNGKKLCPPKSIENIAPKTKHFSTTVKKQVQKSCKRRQIKDGIELNDICRGHGRNMSFCRRGEAKIYDVIRYTVYVLYKVQMFFNVNVLNQEQGGTKLLSNTFQRKDKNIVIKKMCAAGKIFLQMF